MPPTRVETPSASTRVSARRARGLNSADAEGVSMRASGMAIFPHNLRNLRNLGPWRDKRILLVSQILGILGILRPGGTNDPCFCPKS